MTSNNIDKFYMEKVELDSKDPMEIFTSWYENAKNEKLNVVPDQMTLSTVRHDGGPSSRTLLLRGVDKDGFKMYWDNRSRKTEELLEDARGGLVFVWYFRDLQDNLGYKQVRIEGTVETLPQEEVVKYFSSEPVASQIRASVCHQSRVIEDRLALLERSQELLDSVKRSGCALPKPAHYTGYRLRPSSIEFYKGSRDTINDRIRFRLVPQDESSHPDDLPYGTHLGDNGWVYEQLEP